MTSICSGCCQVIQLVRDPRGILASRIETFRDTYRLWRLWRATGRRPHNLDLGQIHTVCEDFLNSVSTGLARPAWLRGRYILLRLDVCLTPTLSKRCQTYKEKLLSSICTFTGGRWGELIRGPKLGLESNRPARQSLGHKFQQRLKSRQPATKWSLFPVLVPALGCRFSQAASRMFKQRLPRETHPGSERWNHLPPAYDWDHLTDMLSLCPGTKTWPGLLFKRPRSFTASLVWFWTTAWRPGSATTPRAAGIRRPSRSSPQSGTRLPMQKTGG